MKSTEVYREINRSISSKLRPHGFRKTKSGMLGFYKLLKEHYLIVWFQCSQDGFDKYAGSKFIVEIQISKSNLIGDESVLRQRIPFFMTEFELEVIAKTENEIVAKLPKPPRSYFIFSLPEDVQRRYLKKFEKISKKYNNSSDIWFVYFNQSDIEKWLETIEPIIIRAICDLEKTDY